MPVRTRTAALLGGVVAAAALAGAAAIAAPTSPPAATHMGGASIDHMGQIEPHSWAEGDRMMAGVAMMGEMHQWMADAGIGVGRMHQEMAGTGMTPGSMHGDPSPRDR